jgi:hypothetical protein
LIILLDHHNKYGLSWPTLKIYIDNQEVAKRFHDCSYQLNIKQHLVHDYDLWEFLHVLNDNLQLEMKCGWVESHQATLINENGIDIYLNDVINKMSTTHY